MILDSKGNAVELPPMEKHEYKGAMPICMFQDLTGRRCHLPRRHEIHDLHVKDQITGFGTTGAGVKPLDDDTVAVNHKLEETGNSASIIFRAQNIEEIKNQEEPAPPKEVIEAQNQVLDYAVNVICSKGTWEGNQRDEVSRLINSFRNTMVLLNAKAQKLHVFRAEKDREYTAGFTDDQRAEFERAARKMEKPGGKKTTKLTVAKDEIGTKAAFVKDQLKTGLYTIEEVEEMWQRVEAKRAAAKPKSAAVTNIASASQSMQRHGLTPEQIERIMKGKKQ